MPTPIAIRGLTKHFGATAAVDALDLDIPAGSLFFLLGPSGCGKTTLLRMIAGFLQPDAGTIAFDGRDVTHTPANERNSGMVFQSYALWPHMTVRQNVAFGLDVRKVSAEETKRRVDETLARVAMQHRADHKPNQLSGGQQQRVALARAMVIEPDVLLLDEPLSNLDAKLRIEMRTLIRQVCKAAQITAVYVTHDQKEALSMADQMAVLDAGKIKQVGAPRELYDRPTSRFVADFLGESNFITGKIIGREGKDVLLDTPLGRLRSSSYPKGLAEAGNVTISIRPEAVRSVRDPSAPAPSNTLNFFNARRVESIYLGEVAQHQLAVGDSLRIKAYELNPRVAYGENTTVRLEVSPEDVVILKD